MDCLTSGPDMACSELRNSGNYLDGVRCGEVRSGRVRSGRVRSGEVRSGMVGSGMVGYGNNKEIHSNKP